MRRRGEARADPSEDRCVLGRGNRKCKGPGVRAGPVWSGKTESRGLGGGAAGEEVRGHGGSIPVVGPCSFYTR